MKGELYPLTIVSDRYTGAYSGGLFTAWNLYYYEMPEEIGGGDVECSEFWINNKIIVGKGKTPNEAVDNLCELYKKSKEGKE